MVVSGDPRYPGDGEEFPGMATEMIPRPRNGEWQKSRIIRYEVVKDIDDIRACLRLRYVTYRYVNFIEENRDRLDIDPYDRYSTFLGAYDVTRGSKILIGTLRIISGDEESESAEHIEELIRSARDPQIREMGERPELFPIMESFTLPNSFLAYFRDENRETAGLHPYELSRLAVRPDYWMHNIDVGLHHLLILDSWMQNEPRNDFLIAVHPRSRRRYERVGFRTIPGTGEVLYKHIEQLAIAMVLDLGKYLERPDSYRDICESLFPRFRKDGYFTRTMEGKKTRNNNNNE